MHRQTQHLLRSLNLSRCPSNVFFISIRVHFFKVKIEIKVEIFLSLNLNLNLNLNLFRFRRMPGCSVSSRGGEAES